MAKEHDVPMPFWDDHEMARHADIDIVDAGTRPSYRHDMCLAALTAGKHLYSGVPFAADLDAARQLRDAAEVAGMVAVADASSGLDVAVPHTAVAALRFEAGPVGAMTTAWAGAASPGSHLELAGSRGRLVLRAPMMPPGEGAVLLGRSGGVMEEVGVTARLTAGGRFLPS